MLKHCFLSQVPSFQYDSCQTLNSYLTHLADSKLIWAPVGFNTCSRAQCTCIRTKSLQVCLIICNPMDGSPPSSSVHGILQARILGWVAILFSRESWHRDLIQVSPIAGGFFSVWGTWGSVEVCKVSFSICFFQWIWGVNHGARRALVKGDAQGSQATLAPGVWPLHTSKLQVEVGGPRSRPQPKTRGFRAQRQGRYPGSWEAALSPFSVSSVLLLRSGQGRSELTSAPSQWAQQTPDTMTRAFLCPHNPGSGRDSLGSSSGKTWQGDCVWPSLGHTATCVCLGLMSSHC